jgi:protein-S-isoprenylcysteine O-methyltransferase Ste14
MTGTIIFLLGSLGFIYLSRRSLTKPSSHGFPRFIAFEGILGLGVLNVPSWFKEPFSFVQIISWILLLGSAFLIMGALWTLRKYGRPDRTLEDGSRIAFEKTTQLVTRGSYKVIRHPMYASLLYLAWGIFLKHISSLSTALVILVSLTLFLSAVYEERENLCIFGDDYAVYTRQTKRFFPFLF